MKVKRIATSRAIAGWVIICVSLLAAILIPFFFYETKATAAIGGLIKGKHTLPIIALALCALLAADVILPVPSSLVSAACGTLLGFWPGLLVSWVGMTVGCLLGYILGFGVGRSAVARLAGETECARIERVGKRYGHWMIILFRAVPVLAEVSVVSAGASRMRFGPFLTIVALSNLGISAVYVGFSSIAADANSFLLAFAGAVLVPAIAWLVTKAISS